MARIARHNLASTYAVHIEDAKDAKRQSRRGKHTLPVIREDEFVTLNKDPQCLRGAIG